MTQRILVTLWLLALVGLSACAPADPLVGTWRQTGTVGEGGTLHSVPESDAIVLTLERDGSADAFQGQDDLLDTGLTWEVDRGLLMLGDNPGGDVRTVYELEYELEGDRLTTDWIDGPPRRIFEKQ